MSSSTTSNTTSLDEQSEVELEFKQLVSSLPKETWLGDQLYLQHGFWFPSYGFEGVRAFQTHFQAHDSDIILTSLPKSGMTWLKSLVYTIVNREKLSNNYLQHPLCTITPHELVSNLEVGVYKKLSGNQLDLTKLTLPRLFATHVPYLLLPDSIKTSKSRIVYICRNPLDNFISFIHFSLQFDFIKGNNIEIKDMIEEYLNKYCKGLLPLGPYEDHLLGFWKESIKNPEKVLFLEYEGLKKEPKAQLKKLAEFVGCPFSEEEEKENVVDKIIELCSLKSLKEMEVNKSGKFYPWFENKALFRKGEVGDWTNYLTPSMAKQFDRIHENLKNAGFSSTFYQF